MEHFEIIAKTFAGLEGVLAQELTAMGVENIRPGCRMVSFTGTKETLYRANFCLRTAVRVLKPIAQFTAEDPDQVYAQVAELPWEDYMDVTDTFAVDAVVNSDTFRHSRFVAYRVKDAIADRFRSRTGRRPGVSVANPVLAVSVHITGQEVTIALDSSGPSLHLRGYRTGQGDAPLNEVLAAGMIMLMGWHGQCDLMDPMCGSGTLAIEAALIARNIAPGVFRSFYAFERWKDFDADLLAEVYNDDSAERPFAHRIYASDISAKAVAIARENIRSAGVAHSIVLRQMPFEETVPPVPGPCMLVMNPPYGERISSPDLMGLYATIGSRLKHVFTGCEAWVLSSRMECFDRIGLKASVRLPLMNGGLTCQFRQYRLFGGRYDDFRREGGEAVTAAAARVPVVRNARRPRYLHPRRRPDTEGGTEA